MTIITDVLEVNAVLEDESVSVKSFGESLILTDEIPLVTIDNRTKRYSDPADVATDWGITSKVYKAISAHFKQNKHNETIKIGLQLIGDANITAALTAIWAEDTDWFELHSIFNDKVSILEIAAWAALYSDDIVYGSSTEDSDVLDKTAGNVIETLKGFDYDNVWIVWYHKSGIDAEDVSITVASGIATVTKVAHGLRINENVTISGAAGVDLNGNKIVASVPTADTWTFATTQADGADGNNGAIDYFARYEFIDIAYAGRQLGRDIGTTSWDGKSLIGYEGTPLTIMTDIQANNVIDQNGNVYITRKGATYMAKGRMVSSRFIENHNVLQWLIARTLEAMLLAYIGEEKIPYTNSGFEIYATAAKGPFSTQIRRTGLNPLNDEEDFRITFPNALDIPLADRINGDIPNAEALCRIGQAVHKVTFNITAVI